MMMDVPPKEGMEEGKGKVSEVVEAVSRVSDSVARGISIMTGTKKEAKGLESTVHNFFEQAGICIEEEREGYTVISEKEAQAFVNEIVSVSEKERMAVPKSRFLHWAFVAHDYNRMHIFPGYADDVGFKKTPTHGTLIAACEEQYILSLLDKFNNFFTNLNQTYNLKDDKAYREFVYSSHSIKFEKPLFPRVRRVIANWDLNNITKNQDGIKLEISALNIEEVVLSSKIGLNYRRGQLEESERVKFYKWNDVVEKSNIEIKKGEVKDYYFCIGKKYDEEQARVFMMHPSSFIIATLLRLSSRRTGVPEGTYRSMNFEFYNEPHEGIFETRIRMPIPPRKVVDQKTGEVGYVYKFKAICEQDERPIVFGDIVCFSPSEYKFDRGF